MNILNNNISNDTANIYVILKMKEFIKKNYFCQQCSRFLKYYLSKSLSAHAWTRPQRGQATNGHLGFPSAPKTSQDKLPNLANGTRPTKIW